METPAAAPLAEQESIDPAPAPAPAPMDWKMLALVGTSTPGEYTVGSQTDMSALQLVRSKNFLKSAKWSPDGTCLLTTSEDNVARLLELPAEVQSPICMRTAVRAREGETIYDSAWYPHMDSRRPETCLFATCARGHPVHLWDAFTGRLTASYTALNAVAELDAALALAFSNDGATMYVTYPQRLCVFETERPAAQPQSLPMKSILPGLLSCVTAAPAAISSETLLAIGTYGGRIGLLAPGGRLIANVTAQSPGVTQIVFSSDGAMLYASGRKHDKILGWDMRKLDAPLLSLHRPLSTHQRVSFALHPTSNVLITGDEEGKLRCYDTNTGEAVATCSLHWTCVNSVTIHPWLPLIALGTGARQFDLGDDDDELDESKDCANDSIKQDQKRRKGLRKQEECVQLWRIGA